MRRIVVQILLVAAVFLCVASPASYGRIIYVDDDAPIGGDGTSWTAAYRFLQNALAVMEAGDELPVSDPCDLMDAPSRLDNVYHVVRLLGGVLEGVEITGGYAHRYVCSISYTRSSTTDHAGGGIWGEGTSPSRWTTGSNAESKRTRDPK